MTKNPFINALVAAGDISLIVALFSFGQKFSDNELGIMAPMIALSLLVISAAIMGYLFVYPSARLLIEGKQDEATKLFLTTLFSFAGIIAVILLAWLLLSSVL